MLESESEKSIIHCSYDNIQTTINSYIDRFNVFEPDVIITISKSATIMAGMLHTETPIISMKEFTDLSLNYKRILIIDCIDDTRKSFMNAIKIVKELVEGNPEIAIMSIFNKDKEKCGKLDDDIQYIGGNTAPDKWIACPWNSEWKPLPVFPTPPNRIKVLDKGFVELVDTFGDELTIVNAARVSFGTQKTKLSKGDIKLIKFLHDYKHFSPFRHIMFRFHIKAPEFVMRQWYKHVIGAETTGNSCTKDHAWNEISGRYKPVDDFHIPEIWRKQSIDSKQASDGTVTEEQNNELNQIFSEYMNYTDKTYHKMLDMGVAREQARIVLPLNQYTEVIWTASAQAVLNFIYLRDEPTSQVEIQQYARVMKNMLQEKFPVLYEIWFNDE